MHEGIILHENKKKRRKKSKDFHTRICSFLLFIFNYFPFIWIKYFQQIYDINWSQVERI